MYGIPITPLGHLAHAVFPLLLLAALLRFFGRGGDPDAPWNSRIDIGLALLTGLVTTVLSAGWMARYFVARRPLAASDFGQYCESLAALSNGNLDQWVKQRSLAAGSLPGLFTDALGIVDGLLVGAWISHFFMAVGLFLWARAAHSRMAGIVAALIACSAAPLVHLSRTVTFYPQTVAACVLSAAGAMLSMRYRTLPAFAFSGIAMGVALLVDVRGLLWALPALGITSVAILMASGWHRKLLGFALVSGALFCSHSIGGRTTWDTSPSLEVQTVYYVDEAIRRFSTDDPGASLRAEDYPNASRFIWGQSGTTTIHRTLAFLAELRQEVPEGIESQHETAYARRVHLMPWVLPAVFGIILGVYAGWRRKWVAAALVGTVVPFAVALHGTAQMVSHSRYLANGITMVPVLLGIGFAAVAWGPLGREDADSGRRTLTVSDGIGIATIVVLLLGMIPTWLSPVATWRAPVAADIEPANSLWHAAHSKQLPVDVSVGCAEALRQDYESGLPVGSRLMGWEVTESPTHNPTLEGE